MVVLLLFSAWALSSTVPAAATESSTLGQPVIGISEGSTWTVYSGFWYVEPVSGIEEDAPSEIPAQRWTTIVSAAPYVNAPGATELVDASGRVIPNAITEDKVYLSNLPQGTYFARNEDRTIVKIVKVE